VKRKKKRTRKKYECPYCSRLLSSKANLRIHKKNACPKRPELTDETGKSKNKSEADDTERVEDSQREAMKNFRLDRDPDVILKAFGEKMYHEKQLQEFPMKTQFTVCSTMFAVEDTGIFVVEAEKIKNEDNNSFWTKLCENAVILPAFDK